MPSTPSARVSFVLICMSLLFLTGCGGKKTVTVSGTLVLPNTVKLANNDVVNVSFFPDNKEDPNAFAILNVETSTFECKTTVSKAKYRIAVNVQPYMGSQDSEKRAAAFDSTVNNMFSKDTSKLTYETTQDSSQAITIDLSAGTVTKN